MITLSPFSANRHANLTMAGALSFSELLKTLNKLRELAAPVNDKHLVIDETLDEPSLQALLQFVQETTNAGAALPFNKISIKGSLALLEQPLYHALIEAFSHSTLQSHDLLFTTDDLSTNLDRLTQALMLSVAPRAAFPLCIDAENHRDRMIDEALTHFYQHVINNIQHRNIAHFTGQSMIASSSSSASQIPPFLDTGSEQDKPIPLKVLVLGHAVDTSSIKKLEVQHVELAEAVQEQIIEEEIVHQQDQQTSQTSILYQGTLLGRAQFFNDPAIGKLHGTDDLLNQEFFGNTTHGIKYLTPEAAQQIAQNCSALATLNPDNLPAHFILKRTPAGEGVLDYDPFTEGEPKNGFTPRAHAHHEAQDYLFPQELAPAAVVSMNQRMINLWFRYGDAGVAAFNGALTHFKQTVPGYLFNTVHDNYLMHFNHWDHFQDNNTLSENLEKIAAYHPIKQRWLAAFLEKTGSSKHNLTLTLQAFDSFWDSLRLLSNRANVKILTKPGFTTPVGGNPVVYMERLLTILENTRDLKEQFDHLKGINLGYYGAYYAVKHEGFQLVASEMALQCDHAQRDALPFNSEANLYRGSLDAMWKQLEPASHPSSFSRKWLKLRKNTRVPFESFYRYIGTQAKSIALKTLLQGFSKYNEEFYDKPNHSRTLLGLLLFVGHERYQGGQDANLTYRLLDKLYRLENDANAMDTALETLINLSHSDIRLNEIDGPILLDQLTGMNSVEFQGSGFDKSQIIEKLIAQLRSNKFAVLKTLSWIGTHSNFKWPMLYALDTAEFLAQEPMIAATFSESLLLFSRRINSERSQAFYADLDKDSQSDRDQGVYLKQARASLIKKIAAQASQNPALAPAIQPDITEQFEIAKQLRMDNVKQIRARMEAVRAFLLRAAKSRQNDNIAYACQAIMVGNKNFTATQFLEAMAEIDALEMFNPQQIQTILVRHDLDCIYEAPSFTLHDNQELKFLLIAFISGLREINSEQLTPSSSSASSSQDTSQDLSTLSISELQEIFNKLWKNSGAQYMLVAGPALRILLARFKSALIAQQLENIPNQRLKDSLQNNLLKLHGFSKSSSFERVNNIVEMTASAMTALKAILQQGQNGNQIAALIQQIGLSKFDFASFYAILSLLRDMPQRNSMGILEQLLTAHKTGEADKTLARLDTVRNLHDTGFPSRYIERLLVLQDLSEDTATFSALRGYAQTRFNQDPDDKVLKLLLENTHLDCNNLLLWLQVTQPLPTGHLALERLLTLLCNNSDNQAAQAFAEALCTVSEPLRTQSLEIIAKCVAITPAAQLRTQPIDYPALFTQLQQLGAQNLAQLHDFIQTTTPDIVCLQTGLTNYNATNNFADFLETFEKAPFGTRNFAAQFNTTQVERVVNTSLDLSNNSPYPLQYRKQWMEAFLLVNSIGHDLPIYDGKPACQLSNQEISACFQSIKVGDFEHLKPFQKRLLALGLIREAVYRTTEQFPYSTQMLAVIDCMMHEGDVVSNIDTGEGKSLVDAMKAALLWIDSDRVDVSTSSLVDARRDMQIYSPFFNLLKIPHTEQPIDSNSPFNAFQQQGINYSTFAQLALFFAKSHAQGVKLEHPEDRVSLVMNESDDSILDDRTIYRSAQRSKGAGNGHEWVYYAINAFVTSEQFKESARRKTSESFDIAALRTHLKQQARVNGKSLRVVVKFDDDQLRTWIDSAILVNFQLRENHDYVIPAEPTTTDCNDRPEVTRTIKLLTHDGKVSPDAKLGNGAQQLLYAKLNHQRRSQEFVIEPESKTISASNNKNLIKYYQDKCGGFMWCSSGTVGSKTERQEQFQKYGVAFSGIAPHKQRRVKHHAPVIASVENAQIAGLRNKLRQENTRPQIVFCKDIDTATRFYAALSHSHPGQSQLFTGLGDEAAVIEQAQKPNMLTVTTSALRRNTDIHYDYTHGMNVFHTHPDLARRMAQASGRTGRQGSPGDVYCFFQAADDGNANMEVVSEAIEQATRQERYFNEELYDLIDLLYQKVIALDNIAFLNHSKASFLQDAWGEFSDSIETRYRELKQGRTYDRHGFISEVLKNFNEMLNRAVKTNQHPLLDQNDIITRLSHTYPIQAQAYPSTNHYLVEADCIPAVITAMSFTAHTQNDIDVETIKYQVRALLSNPDLPSAQANYVAYLQASKPAKALIRDAHETVLGEWMHQAGVHSQSQQFLDRWLGKSSDLVKKIIDKNWLLMFRALVTLTKDTDNAAPIDACNNMKTVITALLDEYIRTSWFVNSARKAEVRRLKEVITHCDSIETVMAALMGSKLQTIQNDIQATGFFSRQNRSGNSRFQNSIDAMLQLGSTFDSRADAMQQHEQLIQNMATEWNNLVNSADRLPQNAITSDYLPPVIDSITTQISAQSGNARVLAKSILCALSNKTADLVAEGMLEKTERTGHLNF